MYDQRPDYGRSTRPAGAGRIAAIAAVGVVAVGALAAGAYLLGGATAPAAQPTQIGVPSSMPAPAEPSAQVIQPSAAVPAAASDPVVTAVAWLHAYRTLRFDDPAPTAWIDHVRPVVTDDLAATYEQYRAGGVGGDWAEFVARSCVSTVTDAGGVIPEEAPRTRSEVSVQVAGTLRTRCSDLEGERPDEALAATLTLALGDDGLWRVEQRLF